MLSRRIHAIAHRRARIQAEIDEESARPHPHWLRLAELKKARLHLKDRLERLLATAKRSIDGPRQAAVGERRRRLRTRSR